MAGDEIKAVQEALDKTARALLRYISVNDLEPAEYKSLAKFMFGCMNQKFALGRRVERRGSGELDKVLRFIGRASAALLKIDQKKILRETEDVDQ